MKETIWRAKRLTREMQSYWKRYDRVERETRRRLEKEAEEQRKMDVELIEVIYLLSMCVHTYSQANNAKYLASLFRRNGSRGN